jgi:ferritin-like protein
MASDNYHEPLELLSEQTRNVHRAIVSLMEELEAVDWYNQRAEACSDPDLAAVLRHNRDEEIEHAMMTLEWLRRNVPRFDQEARTYLFTEGPITEVEEHTTGGGDGDGDEPTPPPPTLRIGSLKDD